MKLIAFVFALLVVPGFAMAASAWDYDSCMENMIRQFSCSIGGKNYSIDLEAPSTVLEYTPAANEKIYGIIVTNIANGNLHVSCDDSADLKQVVHESKGVFQNVSCAP